MKLMIKLMLGGVELLLINGLEYLLYIFMIVNLHSLYLLGGPGHMAEILFFTNYHGKQLLLFL